MECPYCGCEMAYIGVDDGGGDYGSAVCDQYQCPECDWIEEVNCIEFEPDTDMDVLGSDRFDLVE